MIVSGEPAGSIPAVKRQLEAAWGAKVGDTAGMTEIGSIMIFECSRQPGGTHIIEDHFIEETLEYEGDRSVPYGERAERVVTSLGRGFIPLIRYRTNDLVVKIPYTSCGCGRTGDIYQGGIQGRWDDMKLVRGTNVYPRAVESIVRECAAVDEFQILLTREGVTDEICRSRRAEARARGSLGRAVQTPARRPGRRARRPAVPGGAGSRRTRCRASSSRRRGSSTSDRRRSTRPSVTDLPRGTETTDNFSRRNTS